MVIPCGEIEAALKSARAQLVFGLFLEKVRGAVKLLLPNEFSISCYKTFSHNCPCEISSLVQSRVRKGRSHTRVNTKTDSI